MVFARRLRNLGTPQLFVGLAGTLQLAALVYLQFFGNFEALEFYFYSSTLWSSVNIMLALIVAEFAWSLFSVGVAERRDLSSAERPFAALARQATRIGVAVPALLVLGVSLVYESDPHLPAMTWHSWGAALAALLVASAVLGRMAIESMRRADGRLHAPAGLALGRCFDRRARGNGRSGTDHEPNRSTLRRGGAITRSVSPGLGAPGRPRARVIPTPRLARRNSALPLPPGL